jgi:N utilization substance protein A
VDAVGACIGPKRSRISAIVHELNGEKIDIIPYSDDPAEFISRALAPAKVEKVYIIDNGEDEAPEYEGDTRPHGLSAIAVVPHDQLSLAIGNKGQNAKLAAKLTGCKIDIKSDQEEFEIPAPAPKKPAEELFQAEIDEDEALFAEEDAPAENAAE